MNTIYPSLEEARALAAGNTVVPVAMELFADVKTPVEILRTIRRSGGEAYILESASGGENWGRHTFLGYAPKMEIIGNGNRVTIRQNSQITLREGDSQAILREIIGAYKSPRLMSLPPFTGGFVGYFSYEYFSGIEKTLKLTDNDSVGFDDFRLLLFDRVIAFDQLRQILYLIVNIPADNIERAYIEGVTVLKDMERFVLESVPPAALAACPEPVFEASMGKAAFSAAVEKAKRHIREGDIFQCVPSVRFSAPYGDDLLEAYRVLRTTNPSAYMFYIHFDGLQVAGASPETLVSLKDGVVSTYPLAGTCPRLADDVETDALIHDLLNDPKELSEHDMLVDLGRNDLGKVCRFGSVQVDKYRAVKKLSHVCHIASKISGRIADGYGALDVIAAALPAGTLSGAPKKRAMEIIDEIENEKRGVYGGAVGYIDFTGNMDLCIGIRMAVLKDSTVYVQAGAGIVADSVPENEYKESCSKAGAMMEALKTAAGRGSL